MRKGVGALGLPNDGFERDVFGPLIGRTLYGALFLVIASIIGSNSF
jgi:hypothetical protein